jgi:hypothetical protein
LAVVPVAIAGDLSTKYQIKSDPVRGAGNYLVLNDKGNETGRIKSDPLWPSNSNRYLILDKKGNIEGKIRPDYLNKGRWIIETDK